MSVIPPGFAHNTPPDKLHLKDATPALPVSPIPQQESTGQIRNYNASTKLSIQVGFMSERIKDLDEQLTPFRSISPSSSPTSASSKSSSSSSPLTFEINTILKERQESVLKEIETESFNIQALFFDVFNDPSAAQVLKDKVPALMQWLGNSIPDRQLYHLEHSIQKLMEIMGSNLSVKEKGLLENCLQMIADSKEIFITVSALILSKDVNIKEALRQNLGELLSDKISSLRPGKSFLVPIGYTNGNFYDLKGASEGNVKGHTALMKITKNVSGKLDYLIYNTGEGIGNHERNKNDLGLLYPMGCSLTERELVSMMEELSKFSYNESESRNDMNGVYKVILKYKGEPLVQTQSFPSQGPIDNCTRQSLKTWMFSEIPADCQRLVPLLQSMQRPKNEVRELLEKHQESTIKYEHSLLLIPPESEGDTAYNYFKVDLPLSEVRALYDYAYKKPARKV